jgi:hypothetical protein
MAEFLHEASIHRLPIFRQQLGDILGFLPACACEIEKRGAKGILITSH